MYGFKDILGHESVKEHLRNSIASAQISHAYIISGPPGSGKKTLAECFAAALVCDGPGDRPCGMCLSCMQAESHNHPDIIYVTHEKANILVGDIRDRIINDISIKPYQSDRKIYIVPDAEKMNEAAQNALLKTLEEPPEYAVILLLANGTGGFLQTILSRCVVINLKPVRAELITKYLMEKKNLPDYAAKLCSAFSEGSVGLALRYASDSDFAAQRSEVLKLVKNIGTLKQTELLSIASGFDTKEKKDRLPEFLDLVALWFHDVLAFKSTGSSEHVLFADEINDIERESEEYSYEKLNRIFEAIDNVRARLNANVSTEVTMELLLLALK